MASYEDIIDTISGASRKNIQGQVSMFDFGMQESKNDIERLKYNYTTLKEYTEQELLSMEKEMLGIYISGHPLEKYREIILRQSNINTLIMKQANDIASMSEDDPEYTEKKASLGNLKDGQSVKIVGIISEIKKKYTKSNKIMAFVTIEDLYGSCEVIVFENCYLNSTNELIDENIVKIEGRLSIREDDAPSIIASKISSIEEEKRKCLNINITTLTTEQKEKLRGALKFFTGDTNNMQVEIINNDKISSAGGLLVTPDILEQIQDIVGKENANIE